MCFKNVKVHTMHNWIHFLHYIYLRKIIAVYCNSFSCGLAPAVVSFYCTKLVQLTTWLESDAFNI